LNATPSDGAAFRAEAGVQEGGVLLTFVGRLVRIKRVDVLLRAFTHARTKGASVRLAIVGDGSLRLELEKLAADLGVADHVWFGGYRSEMLPVAAGSDIAVLTSDNEGTPVSLIEAGAAGRPAVATRVGGVPDVVTPATGLVEPAGDPRALGEGIVRLALDHDLRRAMGQAARLNVGQRFSAARLMDDIHRLYTELLAARG
jgi:glycosyltransferase involved in cell wall biosynthesis